MSQPLTPAELHQARLASDNGWPMDRIPVERWIATLDALWYRIDMLEAKIRALASQKGK